MTSYPLISVLILNWNRAEELQLAIRSAINQSYPNLEVIVVDNGSTDNSINLTRVSFPDLKIIELERNFGCPGGRNRGIPHCNGEFIFYLDNDGELHRDAIKNSYKTICRSLKIGIVTGKVYEFVDREDIDLQCKFKSSDIYRTRVFQGGISLHRKEMYKKVGYYPDHFMYGGEESFLSLKMADHNYEIYRDETVVLWHVQSQNARNKDMELLNSFFNKLFIAINLYPLSKALIFVIYFMLVYPLHSLKQKIFFKFILSPKRLAKTIVNAISTREPIKMETFRSLESLK